MDRSMSGLVETFSRHELESKRQRDEAIVRWKNEYSSDKLPEHMADEFCLPEALKRMVEELVELRSQNEALQRRLMGMEDAQLRFLLESTASNVCMETGEQG